MLIGRDNYSSIDEKENEPGNQLAGIDFKYYFSSKKASIYGQLVGEDESGYLPSRTFYILGSEFLLNQDIEKSINIEFTDTGAKIKNYVYSHFIYKDGYRYKGDPIGSVFDADSKILIVNYKLLTINYQLLINYYYYVYYIYMYNITYWIYNVKYNT